MSMSSTSERPLAVVTGASSGIGFELARQFAEHGYGLIIAAEDDAINTAAAELQNGAAVEAVKVDLATPEGVEDLYQRIRRHGNQLEAVALNAGIGMGGDFATQTDLDQELKLVDLNVRSTAASRPSTTRRNRSCSRLRSPCATSSRTPA
jgi:uncharacterized protein